jgi:hypothetical protein
MPILNSFASVVNTGKTLGYRTSYNGCDIFS